MTTSNKKNALRPTKNNNAPNPTEKDLPDENVAQDGRCLVPEHAESVRFETGEPCEDGRDAQ